MDISQLANQVVGLLGPAMTAFTSSTAVEAFSKEFGKDAWSLVKSLWSKLEPSVHSDPAMKVAVEGLRSNPDDKRNQQMLSLRLEQLLETDPNLRDGLLHVLEESKAKGGTGIQNYYERVFVHVQTVQRDLVIGSVHNK